jgi:glucose-6-phosphate dehydrogenase assembly protein OpcA
MNEQTGPVVIDSWEGQGVRLCEVGQALGDLRRQLGGHFSSRTAVMTLVAVAPSDEQAYPAVGALRSLAGHHPARIVLLRPDPERVATLDARLTLYSTGGANLTSFEQVAVDVGGQAANHLDSIVEVFTLADLPVVVWYVGAVPDPAEPLLRLASAILIDSRDAVDAGRLRSLLEVARRRPVVDLCWIRLDPWRRLLAALFDDPEHRRWLSGLNSAQVQGKVGPRRLLGGWLVDRLQLSPAQLSLASAAHVEIRVSCRRDRAEALFEVVRARQGRVVVGRARLEAGAERSLQPMTLADDPLSVSLERALTRLEADTVWEHALSAASTLGL